MAKDKAPFESLTGIEQEVQITERTKHAMENYFSWFQNAMSGSPWSNIDLNKKLLSCATENVTAAVGLVQKLSQAREFERSRENSNRVYESAIECIQRADKNRRRNLYEGSTGHDEAIGNLWI